MVDGDYSRVRDDGRRECGARDVVAEETRQQPDGALSHLADCDRGVRRAQLRVEGTIADRQPKSSIDREVLLDILDVVLLVRTSVDELVRPSHVFGITEEGCLVYGDTEEVSEEL